MKALLVCLLPLVAVGCEQAISGLPPRLPSQREAGSFVADAGSAVAGSTVAGSSVAGSAVAGSTVGPIGVNTTRRSATTKVPPTETTIVTVPGYKIEIEVRVTPEAGSTIAP